MLNLVKQINGKCQITRITLARVSAPLQVRLQPVKFTVITDVLFFMALQRTTR